ncbi:hypothetical protein DERP_003492 [Dermatophagoides pteronyssinus]|uniref:Uncharacterized protein n=1 Tax=Dermatophagoides pteronyssinus TaxID=6956 RepID=A0ABQ8JKS5_DERPT|nr:hypothetical protein DERP_003492 [Dermatophagoides pteronyssinus]
MNLTNYTQWTCIVTTVHVIHHLPEVVRLYGPLMVNSAFHVENSMGIMGKKVKSFHKMSSSTSKPIR